MAGFYIASFPLTPSRYEIGYLDIKVLLTNSPDIAVHLYVENELENAKQLIEYIIGLFKESHDLETLPGKILLKVSIEELKQAVLGIGKIKERSYVLKYFPWF